MATKLFKAAAAIAGLVVMATGANAGPDDKLVINGELTIPTSAPAPAALDGTGIDTVYSGWIYRKPETKALEMDDFDNPSFVFVDVATDLYNAVDGTEGKSCASCHADVAQFQGLRAHLPRVNDAGELVTLENLINTCRTDRMGAEKWKYTGAKMSAMASLVGLQSRGMPVDVVTDGAARPFWEKGKELYYTRVGQLDMACSNCHEDNYNVMIRADHLSQGQINGFPTYRLKNAKMNTVHARFKGCMKNIRAQPYKPGGDEFKALELYVASRGNGLTVETPSVRN